MQKKRSKRSKIRAAKPTSGYGHKKKNRGAGHRGGRGKAGAGKRGDFKLMKVTRGEKPDLGKHGFKSRKEPDNIINLGSLQTQLKTLVEQGQAEKKKEGYEIDLTELGYDKLLSKGNVNVKLNIKVNKASKGAISGIEKAGGKVEISGEKPKNNKEQDKDKE